MLDTKSLAMLRHVFSLKLLLSLDRPNIPGELSESSGCGGDPQFTRRLKADPIDKGDSLSAVTITSHASATPHAAASTPARGTIGTPAIAIT
jgi:hypothetical protein